MSDYDQEILKVLKRIEQAVGRSSSSAAVGGGKASIAGGASNATTASRSAANADKSAAKVMIATTKSLSSLGGAAYKSSNALKEVAKQSWITASNFSDLSKALEKNLAMLNKTAKPQFKTAKKTDDTKHIQVQARQDRKRDERAAKEAAQARAAAKVKATKGPKDSGLNIPAGAGSIEANISSDSKLKAWASERAKRMAGDTFDNITHLIDEAFQTFSARGFGTTDAMTSLYSGAAMAGMSLKDYAKMMDDNMGVLSRSASFDDFNKGLSSTRDSLAKFGVFGEDGTRMAMAMQSSAQSLGVPMDRMQDSVNGQISVFKELRKTTGITAHAFEEITKTIMNDDAVRKELLGLSPAERAARQTMITDTVTLGTKLGLSADQSSQLTAALLAQRKSTVKERFQQKGRLSQSMSMAGMDADQIARARDLQGRRNTLSPAEQEELLNLKGELGQRLESMKQDDSSPGNQNIAEQASENLNQAGLGDSMTAAMNVRLAKDTGPQVNNGLGKELSATEQSFGKMTTLLSGISQSTGIIAGASVAMLLLQNKAFIGGAIGKIFSGGAGGAGIFKSLFGRANAPTGAAVNVPEWSMSYGADGSGGLVPDPKKAGRFGKLGKLGKLAKGGAVGLGLLSSGFEAYGAYSSLRDADSIAAAGDGDVGAVKGEAKGTLGGMAIGGVLGGVLGSIIPGLGTAIGISVGSSLGGLLGGWMGKMLGSESANEKNTRELVKITRATAGSETISSNNLDSLSGNVLQTAKAFAQPTAGQLDAYADSKLSPEERKKKNAAIAAGPSNPQYDAMGNYLGDSGSSIVSSTAGPITQIATPTSVAPTSVNPGTVNTTTTDSSSSTAQASTGSTALAQNPQDSGNVLSQILAILQSSYAVDAEHRDLTAQMLRSATGPGRLPDNSVMVKMVNAQA